MYIRVLNSEVSSFQWLLRTQTRHLGLTKVSCLWIEVSLIQGCPYRGYYVCIYTSPVVVYMCSTESIHCLWWLRVSDVERPSLVVEHRDIFSVELLQLVC